MATLAPQLDLEIDPELDPLRANPTQGDPAHALAWAHPVVAEWFLAKFASATEPQIAGWPSILAGDPTLISAPTGSGKTLAAFLVAIDRLLRAALSGRLAPWTHVLYVSPLKALSNDVQKNLDAPLREIRELALQRGFLCPEIRTGIRTGDTPQKDRAAMLRHPPHILVTTPESLYMLLTAEKPRRNLGRVETIIVDEVHAVAGNKRGAHLALTLERLDALVRGENHLSPGTMLAGMAKAPQRIGLSATQNPIQLVANFLFGSHGNASDSFAAAHSVGDCHPQRSAQRAVAGPVTPPAPPDRPNLSAAALDPSPSGPWALNPGPLTLDPWPSSPTASIIQVGQRRTLDLAIEVPSDELSAVASTAMWTEVYDKLATLAQQHRSTLVFVNTRKLVEKISFELANRLGEDAVGAHHGSLSRALRLDAEQRLKAGEIKILIATASLELGIDIGAIDLVCQIQTTRNVAVAMQRVGRAGHWRGAIPKGRFFALTRDDLMEQAALLRKMVAGELDLLEVPESPIDVLMQQIVAACGAEPWEEDALYALVRRAWPYRNLTRQEFDEVLALLHTGIESSRGRYGALLLRDGVNGRLQARRGARSIAITNGGAIPDTALYAVMLQPENVQIATLDEHFAVDSSPGDVVLLGNTSWRIQRIDPAGKVLVEDAHGAPPTIPFWEGEAPQRTSVLSDGVSDLRTEIDTRTRNIKPRDLQYAFAELDPETQSGASPLGTRASTQGGDPSPYETAPSSHAEPWALGPEPSKSPQHQLLSTLTFLQRECFLSHSAALQLITYIVNGRAVLGAVPTKTTIIAERFFDEGGGQQLILHAPFGGRLNKAWGLALRKRFCRGFNFELQAAATDNGINISLAEQHSFPLADVFRFLSVHTARELLEQACIPNPLFKNRWRWAAGRSLQLLRMQKGKRVAPQIQRTRSDDLLASVFPHASACPETMTGDIVIPDHPLVREVMKDTLTEAMDIEGLEALLLGIESGTIQCLAVDTPTPSQFAHELINAMPYAYLDEAGLEERRARNVSTRRTLPDNIAGGNGLLDPAAIAQIRAELFPDIRDEHELHDLLLQLVALPLPFITGPLSFITPTLCHPERSAQREQFQSCHPERSAQREAEGPATRLTPTQPIAPSAPKPEKALLGRGLSPAVTATDELGASASAGMLDPGPWTLDPETRTRHWPHYFARLQEQGRAFALEIAPNEIAWIAAERLPEAKLLWPQLTNAPLPTARTQPKHFIVPATEYREEQTFAPREAAAVALTQGWLQLLGPITSQSLGALLHLDPALLYKAVLAMELQGIAMRGIFEHPKPADSQEHATEWCERRILQRIHRLTLGTLRKQVEPVTPAVFMDWLLSWQHISPQSQLSGEEGVLAVIEQLEGFEAPAIEWERTLLPRRVAHYDPAWLDNLCLAGVIGWGRVSPHPAWLEAAKTLGASDPSPSGSREHSLGPRRVVPTSAAPITFFLRESADWLHHALAEKCVEEPILAQSLSQPAQKIRAILSEKGAAFTADLQRLAALTKLETTTALWELATAGLASADGFDQMRAMMDPRRKSASVDQTPATSLRKRALARTPAGRWSLLCDPAINPGAPTMATPTMGAPGPSHLGTRVSTTSDERTKSAIAAAKFRSAALDAHARILLTRYGVLFRDLLARESNAPKWRDLVPILRRLEARGEIRGGRFVSGPFGEQYALPEAVDSLRAARRAQSSQPALVTTIAAADPLNLVGILVPGDRIPAVPGRELNLINGIPVEHPTAAAPTQKRPPRKTPGARSVVDLLRAEAGAARPAASSSTPGLFS
jgi:ATP-dependent Lhr-like helicase